MTEEEFGEEQLRYMQGVYAQEYEAVVANMNNYMSTSNAIARNIEFIERIESVKGKNMLLSLEAGTYIEAKPSNTKKVFTYVGFGYIVEKSPEDAKAFLTENKKKTDSVIDKLNSEREKVEMQLVNIELKLNTIAQEEAKKGNEYV